MLINVVGWYGEKNTGDNSFQTIFNEMFKDHEVIYSSAPLEKSDRIIFGGGGVLNGSYLNGLGTRPAYALGVDVPLSGETYEKLRKLNFKLIIQRSVEYQLIAEKQGWNIVSYAPDIAFGLPLVKIEQDRKRVAISITKELPEEKIPEVAKFLDWLCESKRIPTFIAMYAGKLGPDSEIIEKVKMQTTYCKDTSVWNCAEEPDITRQMIGRCANVVSMRFHGSIFAATLGRPFVSVANPGKHSLFCNQERMPERFVNLSTLTFEGLRETFEQTDDSVSIASKNFNLLQKSIFPYFSTRVNLGN